MTEPGRPPEGTRETVPPALSLTPTGSAHRARTRGTQSPACSPSSSPANAASVRDAGGTWGGTDSRTPEGLSCVVLGKQERSCPLPQVGSGGWCFTDKDNKAHRGQVTRGSQPQSSGTGRSLTAS